MKHVLNGRVVQWAVRLFAWAIAIALLTRTFAGLDWGATWRVVAHIGPVVLLVIIPFGVALLVDSIGMLLVARAAGLDLLSAALYVRVVSEALHFGAPGGFVASEAAALALLASRGRLTTPEASIVVAGRKWLVMRAHAIYLVFAAIVSAGALATVGASIGARHCAWLVVASAAVPLTLSVVLGVALSRSQRFASARDGLERLLAAHHLTSFGTLVFLAGWFVEAAETAFILRVVGAPLPVAAVLAVESTLSLARSAVAFAPGGFGVQDVGYATVLTALGVSHEQAAAFVLLKRAKELVWITIGMTVSSLGTALRTERTPTPAPGGSLP